MTLPHPRTLVLTGMLAVALVGGLSACATDPGTAPSAAPSTTASTAQSPEPSVSPSAEPTVNPADVTCQSILPASTVETFVSLGWEEHREPFQIGSVELSDGVWCKWGDPSGTVSNTQIYGWSPIAASDAQNAQSQLVSEGWVREEGPDGVFVTENPDTTVVTDEDGYGMTYLFGDGWVTISDTRQGLLVIVLP